MQRHPRHWAIDEEPTPAQIGEVASILRHGGIALFPTDTIYGFHAIADDEAAVERLTAIKGRQESKPFVVIGASIEQLESVGVALDRESCQLATSLWPAPLTLIVPLRDPVAASRGAHTLAVRVPALGWLRQLLALTGPLASTSANRATEPPILEPSSLPHDLLEAADAVFDGGVREAKPSTILDLSENEPRLIREGDPAFAQKLRKTLRISL